MFGLRSLLNTHLYQKRGLSRKALKTNEKSTFLTPRRLGNRPKIAPRRLQEVTFSLLNLHLDFGLIFAPFWVPKCPPLETLFASKIDRKIVEDLPKIVKNGGPGRFWGLLGETWEPF